VLAARVPIRGRDEWVRWASGLSFRDDDPNDVTRSTSSRRVASAPSAAPYGEVPVAAFERDAAKRRPDATAMTETTPHIRPETAADAAAVEDLHDHAFGPGRFVRTASRLREGVAADPDLSLVAIVEGRLAGSVTMTPIFIGDAPALLLGPLAVDPDFENRGIGGKLVRATLERARAAGHRLVLLVGDASYYGRFGFHRVAPEQVVLPGPVDPRRVLVAELSDGARAAVHGLVGKAG